MNTCPHGAETPRRGACHKQGLSVVTVGVVTVCPASFPRRDVLGAQPKAPSNRPWPIVAILATPGARPSRDVKRHVQPPALKAVGPRRSQAPWATTDVETSIAAASTHEVPDANCSS